MAAVKENKQDGEGRPHQSFPSPTLHRHFYLHFTGLGEEAQTGHQGECKNVHTLVPESGGNKGEINIQFHWYRWQVLVHVLSSCHIRAMTKWSVEAFLGVILVLFIHTCLCVILCVLYKCIFIPSNLLFVIEKFIDTYLSSSFNQTDKSVSMIFCLFHCVIQYKVDTIFLIYLLRLVWRTFIPC